MLRTVAKRAAKGHDVAAAAMLLQARGYLPMLSVEFSEDVSTSVKSARTAPDTQAEWGKTKQATEHAMKLLQTYKDVGDMAGEPLLKFHNPRTFEDFTKPVPNFKKFGLRAGEVPKFFDSALMKRADESVHAMEEWWQKRRVDVEEAATERSADAFGALPVPKWDYGKPVELDQLKQVTDKLVGSLEPTRKLAVPALPDSMNDSLAGFSKTLGSADAVSDIQGALTKALSERAVVSEGGKPLPDFIYPMVSELEARLSSRRSEVHARYLKMWAKHVLALPEQALVPLKERDHLLASKWEDVSPKYNGLVDAVSRGPETYGQRLAASGELGSFFLRRSRDEIAAEFPPDASEKEAVALAAQLADRGYALNRLLGPAVKPEGSPDRLRSVEARELTEHLYTEDRYMYKEGMELAERYKAEEHALRQQLKALTGSEPSDDEILAAQRATGTLLVRLAAAKKLADARIAALEEEKKKYGDSPYMAHALGQQQAWLRDPSNVSFDEVLYPQMVKELYEMEMAELDDKERMVDEAEEEELWTLTLLQQSRHIHQHIEFDLPQSAYAHMDPILYKKLDWEVTQGFDLLHHEAFQAADCEQGEYVKDQMGLENLSHHFLPLLRYRRRKARALHGKFDPELTALPVKSAPAKTA